MHLVNSNCFWVFSSCLSVLHVVILSDAEELELCRSESLGFLVPTADNWSTGLWNIERQTQWVSWHVQFDWPSTKIKCKSWLKQHFSNLPVLCQGGKYQYLPNKWKQSQITKTNTKRDQTRTQISGTFSAKYNLNTGQDWHTYITAIYKYGHIMECMQVHIFTNCFQVMALSSA